MYATMLADKNNEAKWEVSPCNSSIYMCVINSDEKEEEEKMDAVGNKKETNLGCHLCEESLS